MKARLIFDNWSVISKSKPNNVKFCLLNRKTAKIYQWVLLETVEWQVLNCVLRTLMFMRVEIDLVESSVSRWERKILMRLENVWSKKCLSVE